jgi:hypothetical protein
MSVMTAPQFVLPADRPLTVADLDLTPDDGCRYELDDGVLVVSPARVTIHQRVLHRLEVLLEAACPPAIGDRLQAHQGHLHRSRPRSR